MFHQEPTPVSLNKKVDYSLIMKRLINLQVKSLVLKIISGLNFSNQDDQALKSS